MPDEIAVMTLVSEPGIGSTVVTTEYLPFPMTTASGVEVSIMAGRALSPQSERRKARSRDAVLLAPPRGARAVKDIVWLAVVGITLATLAVVVGVADVFLTADLLPLVQGCGLASIAFGLFGISDRMSGH